MATRMRRGGMLLSFGVAWLHVLAGGCATPDGRRAAGPLRASPTPIDTDVPIPTGFVLVEQASEDWANAAYRYLRHRYRGRADKHRVRAFYREQMPLVRWRPVSDGYVQGRITMRFEREGEVCTITIEDGTGRDVTRVDVLITPHRG